MSCEPRRSGLARAWSGLACQPRRGVAQLAEQRSPKPQVAGSSPVAPAEGERSTTMQARPEEETDHRYVPWWTLEGAPPERNGSRGS